MEGKNIFENDHQKQFMEQYNSKFPNHVQLPDPGEWYRGLHEQMLGQEMNTAFGGYKCSCHLFQSKIDIQFGIADR
jgi:hypothetical protein